MRAHARKMTKNIKVSECICHVHYKYFVHGSNDKITSSKLYLFYSGSTADIGQLVVLLQNMIPVDTMSGVIRWNQLKFSLNYAKRAKLMAHILTETKWLSVIKFSQSTVSSPYQSHPRLARYRFVHINFSIFSTELKHNCFFNGRYAVLEILDWFIDWLID